MRHAAIAAALLALVAAGPASAAVAESVRHEPYDVTGATEADVRADINAKRPGHYDALAKWWITWRFTTRRDGATCAMARVDVSLTLTLVEPRLVTTSSELAQSFADYIEKLRLHERGHADLARATAARIDAAIAALTAPACEALSGLADAAAHRLIREGNVEQAEYDRRTDHGATQGARWPRLPRPPDRSQYQPADAADALRR